MPGVLEWHLYSKKTHRNLGTFPSLEDAKRREREVQFFKHKGGKK